MSTVTPPMRKPTTPRINRAVPVLHVEDQPCPAWTGNHELTNDAGARTFCAHCRALWWALDEAVRAS